eukprot:9166916-Ditylum_brightwellii.AAC.1
MDSLLEHDKTSQVEWKTKSEVQDMTTYFKVVSGKDSKYGAHILKNVLNNNHKLKETLDTIQKSESGIIINIIKAFVSSKLK